MGARRIFAVFSGFDTRLPEVFSLGAAGAIGGLVNFLPELVVRIFNCCHDKKPGDWEMPAQWMQEAGRTVDQLKFPLNVASGIEACGFSPRVPKTVTSPESLRIYRKVVDNFRKQFEDWKLPSVAL